MAVYDRKDRFYRKAKEDGWRSRAAFKLMEIQKRFSVLRRGHQVVDLGCFPGSWMQVALKVLGPSGRIVGIDLDEVVPFGQSNAIVLQGDIRTEESLNRLRSEFRGKVHTVLSDMSPKLSGIKFKDHFDSYELADMALKTCFAVLREGGDFVVKTFPGDELEIFKKRMKECFEQVKIFIPDATRKTSTEVYLVGKGFQGKRENAVHK